MGNRERIETFADIAISSALDERFERVSVRDPRARPLFEELEYEYRSRYEDVISTQELRNEMTRYADDLFAPPKGAFVLLIRGETAVAGGAFMPHADAGTAEFKRIWASRALRRQGLARRAGKRSRAPRLYARVSRHGTASAGSHFALYA